MTYFVGLLLEETGQSRERENNFRNGHTFVARMQYSITHFC